MELNKRERKYMTGAVSFGWPIEVCVKNQSVGHLDGDSILPVKVGAICNGLIKKGIFEIINEGSFIYQIRATELGKKFRCPTTNCENGYLIEYDDEGNEMNRNKCKACDGLGVIASCT